MKLSANLGFLWSELPLPEAIRAAKRAGFDAVECHWPFDIAPEEVKAALAETELPMLGLNTVRGDVEKGDFGLAALPGREAEARAAIEQAVEYAWTIGCQAVHVMAGKSHDGAQADAVFSTNLDYACKLAGDATILIEPINTRDVPGYHLSTLEQAAGIVAGLGHENLKIMADCYHTQIMGGDLVRRLETYMPMIGHIQIAAVPSRGRPDEGELNYPWIAGALADMGYDGFLGAEYRPSGATGDSLDWMASIQSR
jgi:hydroxypyruvate isomerase